MMETALNQDVSSCRRTDLQLCSTPRRDGKWLVKASSSGGLQRVIPMTANGSNFSKKLRQLFSVNTRIPEDSAEGAPL